MPGKYIKLGVMNDFTILLDAVEQGDAQAARELMPMVYEELKVIAARHLMREAPGQTLQATALVHEAYLKLAHPGEGQRSWKNRQHFVAVAAESIRLILIDYARRKQSLKRGGGMEKLSLLETDQAEEIKLDQVLEVDEALVTLAKLDSRKAQLVKMRYFLGLSLPEVAEMLNISLATAERDWTFARAWLHSQLSQ